MSDKLGLGMANSEWNTVLDPIAPKTKQEISDDLTWNVVYTTGPAKGLGRFFSNSSKMPGSTSLDPKDRKQVADYERKLKEIYKYTYELQNVEGDDTVIKIPRPK